MKTFTYMVVITNKLPNHSKPFLNLDINSLENTSLEELGKSGWELCSIQAENDASEWHLYFKKELPL